MNARNLLIAVVCLAVACPAFAYDPELDEEEVGNSFHLLFNPQDKIFGISLGRGSMIRDTPVFGDYFATLFSNGIEDSSYAGVGLTIRIMPKWQFSPFIGAGGCYNYSFADKAPEKTTSTKEGELPDRGASYWGTHVEAGFRIWPLSGLGLFELMGRYTWSSLSGDRDYWLGGVGIGTDF